MKKKQPDVTYYQVVHKICDGRGFEDDFENAEKVLADYKENEKFALEVEHTIEDPKFDFVCPKCGSNHLYKDDSSTSFFGISILSNENYVCYYCGNNSSSRLPWSICIKWSYNGNRKFKTSVKGFCQSICANLSC